MVLQYIKEMYDEKMCLPAGPTLETISDFWQMIWDVRPAVIVMLTKVDENGKVRADRSYRNSYIAVVLYNSYSANFWRSIIIIYTSLWIRP